jgi:hypothetical protein
MTSISGLMLAQISLTGYRGFCQHLQISLNLALSTWTGPQGIVEIPGDSTGPLGSRRKVDGLIQDLSFNQSKLPSRGRLRSVLFKSFAGGDIRRRVGCLQSWQNKLAWQNLSLHSTPSRRMTPFKAITSTGPSQSAPALSGRTLSTQDIPPGS